jgi:hypothetical protein
MRSTLIGFCKISCIILILLSLFPVLLPLPAYMDHEYTINGSCAINGVAAQGIKLAGPDGAQTESFPGGSYSLFIRLPEGQSTTITITASYDGYQPLSKDIDLNQTIYMDFNLLPLPTVYTVIGQCRVNGTLSSGVAVTDETYGNSTVSGADGAYQMNISVPYGSPARISLVASKSGYDQDQQDIDLNQTTNVNFNLPLMPVATISPSAGASPSSQSVVSTNQSGSGIAGLISGNVCPISMALVLLALILVGSAFYLRKRAVGNRSMINEPSREDIYKLVTGDNRRRRRPRNGEGHTGGHQKLK